MGGTTWPKQISVDNPDSWCYNYYILKQQERDMGYRVLGNTEELLKGYGPRKGLEGPYVFANGRILYYDIKEGSYYDPRTDFYVDREEVSFLHNELIRQFERA